MTTDGTPSPLHPDFRSKAQRLSDGRIAAAQSQALDNSNADPSGANALISRLLAERERAQGSDDPPVLIEVIWPGQSGQQHPLLVVRDQLLLRNLAGPPPGAEHDDTRTDGDPDCDPNPYEQAVSLLARMHSSRGHFTANPRVPCRTACSPLRARAGLIWSRPATRPGRRPAPTWT